MPETTPDLATLQRWMSLVIRHPEDSDAGSRTDQARELIERGPAVAGEIVKPNDRMTSMRRLDVYNGGYLSRLIEVLEGDFDAVKFALGDEGWFEAARDYVYANPSRHPNLNHFGAGLSDFLAQRSDLAHPAFASELARLQWAVTTSFDSPEFEPFDMDALRTLTPEQWEGAIFRANPSVQVHRFNYPTNAFLQGYFDADEPEVPQPGPTATAVYRKEQRVWRLGLTPSAATILEALLRGQPFAQALAAAPEAGEDIGKWFQEWSADGLFLSVDVPEA